MRHRTLALLCMAALPSLLCARPEIDPGGVMNAAAMLPSSLPGGSLAPGMKFVIRGRQLGPATTVATDTPVIELAGVVVDITIGNGRWKALLTEAGQDIVQGIVPSEIATGQARITVSYQNQTSNPVYTRMVPMSVGFYSVTKNGSGPALYTRFHRGDTVTLRATGLGNKDRRESLEIFIASIKARRVEIHDESVSFEIPDIAPSGCNVSVQARSAGFIPSNIVSIFIEPLDLVCGDIETYRSQVSASGSGGFILPYRLSMLTEFEPGQSERTTGDAVIAGFFQRTKFDQKSIFPFPPAVGSCALFANSIAVSEMGSTLRAGLLSNTVALSAGKVTATVGDRTATISYPIRSDEYLHGVVGGTTPNHPVADTPLMFQPGPMTVGATGGTDIAAFQSTAVFPEFITWKDRGSHANIDRGNDVEVHWEVKNPKQMVGIAGASIDKPARTAAAFLCVANASDGKFKIPATVLQSLSPSRANSDDSLGFLMLGSIDTEAEVLSVVSGLDRNLATGVSIDGRTVRFR